MFRSCIRKCADSRGKGIILLLTADAFAVVGLVSCLRFIVEVKLVETISKCQQHQAVNKEKLEDVKQHSAQ